MPGNTETQAAAAGEGAARAAGAEAITFTIFASGQRTNTIIGRATNKVIQDGDMIMAALAVQYQGYIATAEFPFVAGKASAQQKLLLDALFAAAEVQLGYLKDGAIAGEMVRAVKAVFASAASANSTTCIRRCTASDWRKRNRPTPTRMRPTLSAQACA